MQIIVDSDRHHDGRDATAAPLPGARLMTPVVSVLGPPGRVAGLARCLPSGWELRHSRGLDDIGPGDLVLMTGAAPRDVETARAALARRTRVVVLLDEGAPPDAVAAVLTAGADACVRGGRLAILAGHLVACRRRQTAERWSAYPLPADPGRPVWA
jgi:hypothetical protein